MAETSAQYTLRSSRVVLPSGMRPATIVVSNGLIESIAGYASTGAPGIRDLGDLVVMPGLVDTHVHVNEPGRPEWEGFRTATAAAAAGGTTTIVDMPLNSVPATTSAGALEQKRAAARNSLIDVEFWGGVVPGNAQHIDALADAGARGFKCFLSPSGVEEFPAVEERDLREALPLLRRRSLPLLVHAEWPPALRPRLRRTCLTVPASSGRMLEKAATLPADEVVVDLEDGVAPSAKEDARERLPEARALGTLAVRMNGLATPWWPVRIIWRALPRTLSQATHYSSAHRRSGIIRIVRPCGRRSTRATSTSSPAIIRPARRR